MTDQFEAAFRGLLKSVLLDVAREVTSVRRDDGQREHLKSEYPMLLRSAEAAELLAVSERHLHAMTRNGLLACVRVGRLVRYRPETLRDWIARSESAWQQTEPPKER